MLRSVVGSALVAVVLAVSGCSFSPVYSDANLASTAAMAFNFNEPKSRLEQIVYQELALRFASSNAPNTPQLTVNTRSSRSDSFLSKDPGRRELFAVTVTAIAVVTLNEKELFRAERRATAQYTSDNQVLADREASIDAEERAAQAAAESLRLAILATY